MNSFPWDSKVTGLGSNGYPTYDRTYTSEELREVYKTFFTDGIFPDYMNEFAVTIEGSRGLKVDTGACVINGTVGISDTVEHFTVPLPSSTDYQREDAIVLRWDAHDDARAITVEYVKGPEVPDTGVSNYYSPTRNEMVYELVLAQITVGAHYTGGLLNHHVKDTRLDEGLCGPVTTHVTIDTSSFVKSVNDAITELGEQTDRAVELAKGALDSTLAGQLQNSKVDRSGDTMTGPLHIENTSTPLELKNPNYSGASAAGDRLVLAVTNDDSNLLMQWGTETAAGKWTTRNNIRLTSSATTLGKPLAIGSGGTGATSRSDAITAVTNIGNNPTTTSTDTITYWRTNRGYAYYSKAGGVNGQPTEDGILVNYTNGTIVQQEWFPDGSYDIYRRYGYNGSLTSWVRVPRLSEVQSIPHIASWTAVINITSTSSGGSISSSASNITAHQIRAFDPTKGDMLVMMNGDINAQNVSIIGATVDSSRTVWFQTQSPLKVGAMRVNFLLVQP